MDDYDVRSLYSDNVMEDYDVGGLQRAFYIHEIISHVNLILALKSEPHIVITDTCYNHTLIRQPTHIQARRRAYLLYNLSST